LEQVESEDKVQNIIAKVQAYTSMPGGALLWHLDAQLS
jgi:hypothetical protein